MKKYIIEFIGTFFLVLVIGMTGYHEMLLGTPELFAPIAIGAIVIALIYVGGPISGAHYNPAATLAIMMRKKISAGEAAKYIAIQLLAAISAALVFYIIFKSAMQPPYPNPGFSNGIKPMIIEMLFTFVLVLVILNMYITTKGQSKSYSGFAIGLTVIAGIIAAGPYSGGVMNPATALGPMIADTILAGSSLSNAWFYLVGQFAGGALAAIVFGMTNPDEN